MNFWINFEGQPIEIQFEKGLNRRDGLDGKLELSDGRIVIDAELPAVRQLLIYFHEVAEGVYPEIFKDDGNAHRDCGVVIRSLPYSSYDVKL